MLIFPAIDLYGGKAVRLYKGDYNQMTVYHDDPVEVAKTFAAAGATHIHLVDLEGAKSGTTPHLDLICRIKEQTGLFCEVGGGIRTRQLVDRYTGAGIDRVILGTAAVTDPTLVPWAVEAHPAHIAVGVDMRDGQVAVKGWTQSAGLDAFEFCEQMQRAGVSALICTDISKDGAMQGANIALYRELQQRLTLPIVASGGVSSLDDIQALKELSLYGAILGKAYYTGAVDLAQAIEVAQ